MTESQVEEKVKEALEKYDKWKKQLSGAFESRQLLCSFFVLGVFYLGYLADDFESGNNNKDEDLVSITCSCMSKRRNFYISWFSMCCLLWLILHTFTFVAKTWPKNLQAFKVKHWQNILHKCVSNQQPPIVQNIKEYDFLLKVNYYKLFVVGYFKSKEEMKLAEIFKEKDKEDVGKFCSFKNVITCAIPAALLFLQYLAQLGAIPLLILQMFDTYTLMCLGAKRYCSDRDEYKLNLDQAAITFGLYCCLGASLLTAALMQWDPVPKKNKTTKPAE